MTSKARNDRRLQQYIGRHSTTNLKKRIRQQLLRNCNVSIDDVKSCNHTWSCYSSPVRNVDLTNFESCHIQRVPLPLLIYKNHKHIGVFINFFFINGYLFQVTKYCKDKFYHSWTRIYEPPDLNYINLIQVSNNS